MLDFSPTWCRCRSSTAAPASRSARHQPQFQHQSGIPANYGVGNPPRVVGPLAKEQAISQGYPPHPRSREPAAAAEVAARRNARATDECRGRCSVDDLLRPADPPTVQGVHLRWSILAHEQLDHRPSQRHVPLRRRWSSTQIWSARSFLARTLRAPGGRCRWHEVDPHPGQRDAVFPLVRHAGRGRRVGLQHEHADSGRRAQPVHADTRPDGSARSQPAGPSITDRASLSTGDSPQAGPR